VSNHAAHSVSSSCYAAGTLLDAVGGLGDGLYASNLGHRGTPRFRCDPPRPDRRGHRDDHRPRRQRTPRLERNDPDLAEEVLELVCMTPDAAAAWIRSHLDEIEARFAS
jgi:hypothetical protein